MKQMKVNLYACGGTGINIASQIMKIKELSGKLEIVLVDTSTSNLQDITTQNMHIVEDRDGSGKYRPSNLAILAEQANEILHKYKPATFNIVVHSASGGTGSVIGPLLTSKINSKEHNDKVAIPIIVGSTGSEIELNNTINTLRSYSSLAQQNNKVIAAFYRENSKANISQIDKELIIIITMLLKFLYDENRNLDTADVYNFINYNVVTRKHIDFTLLDFYIQDILIAKAETVCSVVTLTTSMDNGDTNILVGYQAVGFTTNTEDYKYPIHLCNKSGSFAEIMSSLNEKLKEYDEVNKLYVYKPIYDGSIPTTESGLIL